MTRHHSDALQFVLKSSLQIIAPDPDAVVFAASENHLKVWAYVETKNDVLVAGVKLNLTSFELQKLQAFTVTAEYRVLVVRLDKFQVYYFIKVKAARYNFYKFNFLATRDHIEVEQILIVVDCNHLSFEPGKGCDF